MPTISTGDIALTTQFDFAECEAIEATDQTTTQSTAYRRPISVSLQDSISSLGIGNLTVPSPPTYGFTSGTPYPDGPIAFSRLIDRDLEDTPLFFGANSSGVSAATLHIRLHYDFLEIKEDSLLNISSIDFEVDCQNLFSTGNFHPSSANQTQIHPTVSVGLLENNVGQGTSASATTTSTSRQTLSLSLTPSTMPKQHGFWFKVAGVTNANSQASIQLLVYGIKARVNYTGKTNLKTGFIKAVDTAIGSSGAPALFEATTGTFNFSDRISTDTGYSIAGVSTLYGFNSPRKTTSFGDTIGAQHRYNPSNSVAGITNNGLSDGNKVSIFHDSLSANVKYIDSDLQDPSIYHGWPKDDFYLSDPNGAGIEDNINLYYAVDEDNSLGFSIADARNTNLKVQMNIGELAVSGDRILDSEADIDALDDGTYSEFLNGQAEARIQWAVRPPLITGDIALSTSISVSDFAIKQTHGVDASELPDVSFSADTGSTLGGFKIQVESDVATALAVPDTEARIRIRGESAMSTNIDLTQTGLAGMIRTGYTIDPDFSITVADTAAINSINFIGSPADIQGNLSFDQTGLAGVLFDMPASRVGTYSANLSTTQAANIYKAPAKHRLFRPNITRKFVFQKVESADRQITVEAETRQLQVPQQTRKFEFDKLKNPVEYAVYTTLKTSPLRILDMRGTGDG